MTETILVTGANGFLGSFLVPLFVKQGYKALCLVRPGRSNTAQERLSEAIRSACNGSAVEDVLAEVEAIEGDFSKENLGLAPADYRRLAGRVDHIFHCAAMTTFSPNQEADQWQVNVVGTENILKLACECCPDDGLHYVSTAYVAGDRTGTVYESELDTGQSFFNGYERSKFKAEKLVQHYRTEHGLPVTVYRPSVIVGESTTGRTVLFNAMYLFLRFFQTVRQAFTETRNGKTVVPVRKVGNPDVTKNYVHIDYVVDMIMTVFLHPEAHGRTYHLTHDNPPTLDLLRQALEEILDITDTRFVSQEEFDRQPPSEYEKLLQDQTVMYHPYLLSEPVFDKQAIRQALPTERIPDCPPMDKPALLSLFSYAVDSRWGRKAV